MKKILFSLLISIGILNAQTTVLPGKSGGTGIANTGKTLTMGSSILWPVDASGVLTNNGSGTLTWAASLSNALTNGYIFIGNASNIATGVLPTLSATPGTFSVSNGGIFTLPNATTSLRGLLSSTDWNTFNNKQTAISFILPLSITGTVVSMPKATASDSGYLSKQDWSTFNNKSPAVGSASLTTAGVFSTGTWSATPIANAYLANSTISGISLGSNLANHVAGYGISGTNYNGATTYTWTADSSGANGLVSKPYFNAKTALFLTGNQSITLSGDVTGSGSTAITTTIGANKVVNSMINSVAWSKITSTPTTLSGYGITDAIALTTNPLSQFAATTSAQLAATISDETGSGYLVFGTGSSLTSATLTTSNIGTPSAGTLTNCTGLVFPTGVTGTHTIGDIFQASSTTAISRLAAGAVGTILRSTGTGSLAAWTTATYPLTVTASQILYPTATNVIGSSSNFTYNGNSLSVTNTDRTKQTIYAYQNQNTAPTNIGAIQADVASNSTSGIAVNIVCFANSYGTPSTGFGGSMIFQGLQEVSGATTQGFGRIGGNWTGSSGNNGRMFLSTNSNSSSVFTDGLSLSSSGVYIGTQTNSTVSTALLHIAAGTASASTAPLKFTSGTNNTTAEAGTFEYDGTHFFATPSGTTRHQIATILTATATIDFASTAAGSVTTNTMTLTGAADGDAISLGTPNGSRSTTDISGYEAWVSATNTITIKFWNANTIGAVDPASGTYKVTVIKN